MRALPSVAMLLALFATLAAFGLNRTDSDEDTIEIAPAIAATQRPATPAAELPKVVAPPMSTPLTTCPATLPEPYASDAQAKGTLVVVWKSLYMLGLYQDGALVSSSCAPIAMGLKPWGAKFKTDGVSTPEGWYTFATKQDVGQTTFYRGFMLNYPNADDVNRAAAAGIIDENLKRSLLADIAAGRTPPQGTKMGGEILIHGEGAGVPVWTAGCVAVENEAMDFLFDHVRRGDNVLVTPWTERYAHAVNGELVVTNVLLPEGPETELTIPFQNTRFAWTEGTTSASLRINSQTGDVTLTLH